MKRSEGDRKNWDDIRDRRSTLAAASGRIGISLIMASALAGWAAAPSLEHFHPPGIALGSTNTVRVTGKFEPWPPKVWVDTAGIDFIATTNKGEFQVTLAADTSPGVRLVRLFNEEGASEPRPFAIGGVSDHTETEPNDHFAKPQPVDGLPLTINGRLEKRGDVDSYAIALKAGQGVEARVDSFVLMSRLDAVLRLVTTNGLQLAWNHDFATIDPRLTWTAPHDQTVVVQVFGFVYPANAEIALSGGDGAIYRLHLSESKERKGVPATGVPGDKPPANVDLPFVGAGTIATAGAAPAVTVSVAEAGWLAARVNCESIGSPLDAWLAVEDATGKQLHRNDDFNESRDAQLEWQAAATTNYVVKVGSLTRRSGTEQQFELTIRRVEPDFEATVGTSSLSLKPGSTNELKVTVTRLRGFTNELQVLATNLPAGINCAAATVGEKGGEVKLSLIAETNAVPFQGPFSVTARNLPAGRDRPVPFKLTGSTTDNGVPGGYRTLLADRAESIWLTVLAAEPPQSESPVTPAGK